MAKEFVIKHGFISKGDSIVSGSLSGETLNLTNSLFLNNLETQVLVRNNTTGLVEYRDASTFSGASGSNTFVTGFTYNDNNTFTINDNAGSAFTATINQVSGLTVNGTLSATTLDGGTIFSGGTNLLTIIDDRDDFVTGTTFGSNQAILTRNDGTEVFKLSGSSTVQLTNPSGNKIDIDVTIPAGMNTFVTGYTYDDNNTFTISDNLGSAFTATINQVSGLTVNGDITVTGTSNLNVVTATTVDFDLNYTGTTSEGRLSWNSTDATLDLGMGGGNATQQIGQEIYYRVKNQSGSTISNGRVVRNAGSVGASGRILGEYMIADGTYPFAKTLGIATEDILNGSEGLVTEFGVVRGLNTTGSLYGESWLDGDVLYVSPTIPGGLTNVEPQAPNQILEMGVVLFSNVGNGSIFVDRHLSTKLGDISDVQTTGATNGDLIVYNSATTVWDYSKTLTGDYDINGSLSATTLDGNILLSGGTNLITIIESLDTYVTGGTVSVPATDNSNSGNIGLFYKNSDGIPRTLPFEDTYTTGSTYDNGTALATFNKNDGTNYTLDLSTIDVNDTFVTGTTFSSNEATLTRNDGTEVLKLTGGTNVTLSNPSSNQIKIDVSSSSSSIDTGNVLWVDNIFGNNGTALVDRQDKPWSSIVTALSNATTNDTIMVRPGEYVEPDFTLIPGTSLISQGGAKVTFISASTPTGNFITVSGSSYMEGFTIYTPTDDSAALYFNDPTGGIVTSFHNVHFKGSSTDSPPLGKGVVMDSGLTNGKIIYTELRYGGSNLDRLVEVNKGIFALDGMHVPGGGTINTGVQANGGRLQLTNVNIGNPLCDTALSVSGTSSNKPVVVGFGFNIFNVPTGIEITSDDYDVEVQGGRLEAGTTNVLVTSGLTGSNGKLDLTGFIMDSTKLSVPFTWVDSKHTFQYSDIGNSQNIAPILRTWSNFEVGHANKGFETNLGRGSEYQNGLHVHTSGASSTSDYTLSAKTPGSTFTFESLTAGEQLYLGSSQYYPDGTQLNFNGFEALYTGSTGGTYTMEFYSGGTWVDIKYQCVHHNLGHNYSNNLFGRNVESKEDMRFGIDESITWDSLNIASFGSHTAKWIRITMVTPPASLPQFDLIWLEPSHTEVNDNGVLSFFGNALYKDTLVSAGNIYGESGGVVSGNVPVGSGGLPTGWDHNIKNSVLNQNGDAIYFQAAFPRGICTAYPLNIIIYYGLDPGDSAGSFTTSPQFITSFLARGASGTKVNDPSGGLVPTPRTIQNTPTLTSSPGSFDTSNLVETGLPINTYAGKPMSIQDISFEIDDYYEGDGFLVRIELDDDGTPNQDVTIFAVEVDVVKWALGERIRIE